jgi:hypothetical protein
MGKLAWLAIVIVLGAGQGDVVFASAKGDLWQRIRDASRLAGMERKEVSAQIAWIRDHKLLSVAVQERAKPVLYYIPRLCWASG